MEGRIINVRKLVALDLTLHGPTFIGIEFGVGTPVIIAVGTWLALAMSGLGRVIGIYLLLTGVNYLPILAYTIVLLRSRSWKREVEDGLSSDRHYVRKYSVQQLLILVPVAIVLLAVIQRQKQKPVLLA